MQSSTAIALRALVMLICMISIPLFAIFGKDLPEVIKNLLAGRLVVSVTDSAPANRPAAATPTSSSTAIGKAGPQKGPFTEPASYRAEGGGAADRGFPSVQPRPPDAPPAAMAQQNPGASPPGEFRADVANPAPAQPAVDPPASGAARSSNNVAVATPASAAVAGTDGEQFRRAEARLRELGATHYTLETWGSENNKYRFVCKVAVGGNPSVNRYFQSIEDDPWRAMDAVLQQVETWRAQQPQ